MGRGAADGVQKELWDGETLTIYIKAGEAGPIRETAGRGEGGWAVAKA